MLWRIAEHDKPRRSPCIGKLPWRWQRRSPKQYKPANGISSNHNFSLTHLYPLFGILLGQSNSGAFSVYSRDPIQYNVPYIHEFVKRGDELFYYTNGVSCSTDVAIVANAFHHPFNCCCSRPVAVILNQPPQLQEICINPDCLVAKNAQHNGKSFLWSEVVGRSGRWLL